MKRRTKDWPKKVTVGRETVSVYRRKTPQGNFAFMVANYATGKRRFDSYDVEQDAIDAASTLARRLSTQDTKAASLTEKQAMEYIRATDVLAPFNLTVGAGAEALAESLKKVGDLTAFHDAIKFYSARHKKLIQKPVAEVVAELLAVKEAKKRSTRHLQDIRSRLQHQFAKKFIGNIGSIATSQIQAWLDSMNYESEYTYRNMRSLLNLLFNFAVRRGYAVDNIIVEVERAEIRDDDEVGIYTPEDISKLLAAANETHKEFLPCLAIGAFAGLRSAEIERLEWSDIDIISKIIVIRKGVAKTAMRRNIPMSQNLLAWLAPYAKQTGIVWTGTHDSYYETQQEVYTKAEVAWVHNGLRHSFGSYRYAQLGDAGKLAGEMGNTASVVHKHYRELVKITDAEKFFAVKPKPQYGGDHHAVAALPSVQGV